jgi:hypothetical protein
MKTMICWKYAFQNLNQYLQGDNVVDDAATIIDGFHWGDICVSSTQMNKPI